MPDLDNLALLDTLELLAMHEMAMNEFYDKGEN
jgi:hypothetical protein